LGEECGLAAGNRSPRARSRWPMRAASASARSTPAWRCCAAPSPRDEGSRIPALRAASSTVESSGQSSTRRVLANSTRKQALDAEGQDQPLAAPVTRTFRVEFAKTRRVLDCPEEVEALLVVAGHVEAGLGEHRPDRRHVGGGTADEDLRPHARRHRLPRRTGDDGPPRPGLPRPRDLRGRRPRAAGTSAPGGQSR
jgi:hypothetical protein